MVKCGGVLVKGDRALFPPPIVSTWYVGFGLRGVEVTACTETKLQLRGPLFEEKKWDPPR
jgi:hypothetical protein